MKITNKNIDRGTPFDWGKTSLDYAKFRDIYPQKFYQKIVDRNLCIDGQVILMPKFWHMLKQGGSILVLYMAWLPFEDKIAGASENLVLKYNPNLYNRELYDKYVRITESFRSVAYYGTRHCGFSGDKEQIRFQKALG